ncbi:hypothetical protein PYW07_007710 [Mythimna separata]|uniref:Lipocalin/cytosolic fatty-acid binding domain-containing protein n=1 Tax=Mythimna separata TaxID=271217 RepID=A0AAD7YNW2_MYTSE|nr:hypothetical protein PYW07_007710 [Mythimna separata]
MMSKVIVLILSLFGLISVCVAQIIQDGQCASITLESDFRIESFFGVWFEYARTDNPDQQGECPLFELTDNNGLQMNYTSVNNNFLEEILGTATQDGNTGRFQLTSASFRYPIDFLVHRVDYDFFAITLYCQDVSPSQRMLHLWILTRNPEPSGMTLPFINNILEGSFGIGLSSLKSIDHSSATCDVLPVIEPGEPIIFPGYCNETLPVVQNFEVNKFLGLWHQISSYESPNGNGACARAEYTQGDGVVNILNSEVVDQEVLSIDGYATVSGTDAKLSVVLNIPDAPPTPRELWILRTDYESYAVAYSCVNMPDEDLKQRRVYSWILSRTRQLSSTAEKAVQETMQSYLDLNPVFYTPTNQSDAGCFFYPEPSDQPVVFRGQCESVNVQAMQTFEADKFMGTWHNIEMYPSRFQSGTCSNANYELVDGNVIVVNSQVNDLKLETIQGVGVPALDGSAKLVVTFPVPGSDETESTDYWVLDTDYTNYAFVYTCKNLNDDEMQVGSWKLSRTKQLLPNSELAINEIMSDVLYLDERYYETQNQTEGGCFYFPEPQDNVPVVFPGQCDETVEVLQNFNLADLEGIWYEIESYPKTERTGQCVNHQFTSVDTTRLNLVSSAVADQFLGLLNGVVTRSDATNNSGNLTIAITDANGQAKNVPFWVLDASNDFIFAYGCENINVDFRAVWSWKLSRTRELSEVAKTAISNAMEGNKVLEDRYFEKIDHSNEACFYLPELEPGEPVILPGPCDDNIEGISNFDIEKYIGRWRLIDSYGSDFQDGTCNVARYTQQASNILAFTNSQVVNGQLASISGTATLSSTEKGKLRFYFPSRDESFDVTILDTDYVSYSLGYGCVDLPNNQRRVYSWKMSRENTLSQDAINNMDKIINNIQVLNNRFYYRINRTDAGCFYLPTPDPSTSVKFRGQCDQNIPVVTNFEAEKYLGRWFDVESYPEVFQNGQCNTAVYSGHPDANIDVDVLNTQVIDQTLFSIRGSAVQDPSTDGSAKLTVTFNVGGTEVVSKYWVLATDYDSYSLVYSCRPIDDEYVQVTSWKLSRTRQLTSDAKTEINKVMSNIRVLEQQYFIERDHSSEGCFYFPEPQPGVPVVFPGQCNENIAAVPNFNMKDFEGTWHEITGYPKANQDGQCISQQFTVNSTTYESMRLDSFSVLDLTQSTTEGHVTFAKDDDTSGKLVINILVNGNVQSIPYWILSTNYIDYALAYSCVNIDEETRGVWSWKLSRTRQLSAAGNAAIDDAIVKVDVLRNEYYENVDQTDTACFHLPDITPGDNVVLPGRCDSKIVGMPNFDLTKYAGEWRLIESYGSPQQIGTCNVAQYTQQDSLTLSVTNSQVVNALLASTSGTATVSSGDGSGRLTFSIGRNVRDIYILETDYDSFALAYGCEDLDNDQRRVTSWKFSRSNTLSDAANDRIKEIMNGIEVLHQPYYYTVNRSPDACFYFPEPDRYTPVRFRGQCNESIPVVTNFDVEKYLGLWYDVESYPMAFQDGECPNARYSAIDSSTVSVYNTQVVDQTLRGINGLAVASSDGSAKLKVTFEGQSGVSDYWVLDTDYNSYAFVYSCRNDDDDYMSVTSWKLSRTRQLTSDAKNKIDAVMSDIRVLDQRYFIERDQGPEACFYFPEPQPGVPVVFPGQCNENIAAVPNFNMKDFEGTWHEIAGYPKVNQDGQCISQQFTVNEDKNSMRLDSFSVLDVTQSTTEGHVTFARDDDTSGKLVINISVNGEVLSIPYWILSTNYIDYALAYSCVNIDEETRGVWSWKLSRTRQLSAAGNAAIDDAIVKVDVLRNEYYESVDQTDTACFHLPDITPGDNVVLPGRCDSKIVGMPNFDLTKYVGEWRLIESYGSPQQIGTCNVAQYTQQDSLTLSVTNSQVVNALLASTSGTATVSSGDGSGRLTFSIGRNVRDIYILETDYDSFALAYGCEDLDNDQRRVTSWKLSRSNTLSDAANDRIKEIMNGIEVLHQPYYYTVNRSPDACFYFPEPDRYTPVRFRGRCDENIPVVSNFDVEKYLGLWYDVESYPMAFQDGECPNARYSAIDSSTVSVYNTQVVDQTLRGINGLAVASSDGSAKLKVTFEGQSGVSDYWVLDTDYSSYAFVYSCRNDDDDYMSVTSWKLSRTRQLTSDAKNKIDAVMSDIRVLDQRYFIERDQGPEACFYFPEPQPGVPVVFPGQCNENIAAVPNFNMKDFEGTWHEIAGYPKVNQDGQCISQQFTVNEDKNSMRLDSFSVLDVTQSTTEGHVTFARDDDTSGKLVINISVNGEVLSIPYWILSTNYIDYALAYSCVNIDEETRGVWSWKLSRTRQLSAAGNAAIDDAIVKVDVLRNEYYESVDQTDTACFHLPDITPGDNVVLPGRCDSKIVGMPNFDLTKYVGEWRLIESYGSPQQIGTCNVAQYTQQDSLTLSVTNSQVVNALLASTSGTATVSSGDGSGRLTFSIGRNVRDIYILETDYDSFALAYGCEDLDNDQRRVTSWKLSRSNTLSDAANDRIKEIMNGIEVLHQPYYYTVNRSPDACFYFPEPDRYTPVRFRGRCDENIPVVSNFDVEKYLGLWYDVESYPMAFQDGECPNARYSAIDSSTVSVYNTQVVDQTLRGINGLAVASSDGSAKLKVTFEGQSGVSDYWVLDTDYSSYAFVYSCRNDDDDYMSVTSWKLSRTRQLTSDAKNKIDAVMSDIRVLDQRYFIERDQGPEACFYFPEPQPGVPVVFPGQCNENIAAVPNFNMKDFEGTWHEITGYPKANQDGQCISQQFTVNSTTYESMRLDSFSVLDQAQLSTEGHVTFARDDDTSGKLVINIWVNGEAQSIPYWILSTDYIDYALVYSCVNIDEETRGIWSWKLSRSRQLSDAGNEAINAAISNVDVLDNKYYENIQQEDSDCFFYPDLGPNDPVVFPGRCDANIPVLQNFEPSRYLGTWRLIESYYSDFQSGSCITATYTLADDGSVIVLNSKVVDEQLNSVTGSAVIDPNGSGKLTVTFPNSTPTKYWILDTDYDSFAFIYSCVDLPNDQRRVWSWKMSRSNSLTDSATNAINEIINRVDVLDARYFNPVDRTNVGCFYYPTPDSTSSVIFPGQCDESIPVVSDFKADLYSGRWYDVESYPSTFQSGTCNTATYTLNPDGTLTIENTQVVNQLQQTVTGSAVPSTTDGSAKFKVTITDSSGNDLTTNYWILATDYETYSFVYSCRNINEYYRQVFSWKLGKEPIIPQNAENIINDIIDNVQVLSEQYYVQRKHTSEACFYYPDNKGGDVIMDGKCISDAEVPAVTNFDANAFSGLWHEVSRFPSTLQNGECTSSHYNLIGANTFDVIQTSVIAEEKLETDTEAALATDGRGVIRINVNGVPFDDVYILDTVYNDYALLYSCRDLDGDKKQLYSWKLSRSRDGLSEAANHAIDELVSSNIDLHEPYYRTTRQDNEACFYYPVFEQAPQSIELPGPCNESVAGIPNFNMANFIGQWYEIARYPQPAQTGQCSRPVFGEVSNSGTVTIVNTQVTDEALGEIFGEATAIGNDGQIEVTFQIGEETRTAKYYVLGTDYQSYALLYSCVTIENGNRRRVGSWKLSRTTELSQTADDAIDVIVSDTQGLIQNYYQETSQTDAACFYYPEFEQLPDYIDLPGACNTSITGVADFDVESFIGNGKWFEIARYPQPAQTGQCNLVEVENGATSNSLSFVISQIFDESLAEISGVASVVSSDGSGKLRVTFNIEDGAESVQDYFVLTTDYTGYALIYTCLNNPGSNTRRVGSWKLSRNTGLSEGAKQEVDRVISITQGLRQEYYQETSHSDQACFHYPEQTGDRVIIPGQCDTDIPAVESFNVARFANNSWYQIERYDAVGDRSCIGTRLTFNEETSNIQVLSFEVVNEELLTTEGSGKLDSTDGSGIFTVVMDDGEETETTIYILATDYDGFALAYSCKNLNSSQRQVGVWQLSRGRTMTDAGKEAIAAMIKQRPELHEPYFKSISHEGECLEPSSAFLFKSSIILIVVCTVLQLVW